MKRSTGRRWITAITLMCAIAALILPATASAAIDSSYKGWVTVTPADGSSWASAWSWRSTGWARAWHSRGERVYAWPYGSGWSWAWDTRQGWVAMRSNDLSLNATTGSVLRYGYAKFTDGGCGIQPDPDIPNACGYTTVVLRRTSIKLVNSTTNAVVNVVTDANGYFRINLAPGTYVASIPQSMGSEYVVTTDSSVRYDLQLHGVPRP